MRKGLVFKLVLITVAIAIVSIIVGYIYYFQLFPFPSKIETGPNIQESLITEDWKFYEDKDLNISLKYPQDWFVNKRSSTSPLYIHNYTPFNLGLPFDPIQDRGQYLVAISRATAPGSKSADDIVNIMKKPVVLDANGTTYYFNQKTFKVNDYRAFYVESSIYRDQSKGSNQRTYLLDGKGGGVIFTAGRDKEGAQLFINDIMSTVKFTK